MLTNVKKFIKVQDKTQINNVITTKAFILLLFLLKKNHKTQVFRHNKFK